MTEARRLYKQNNELLNRFGLTLDQANALKARGCSLCGSFNNIQIDHSHTKGFVRGPLCARCNIWIGEGDDLDASVAAALV